MTSKYLSRSTNDGTARSFPYNPPKVHPGEFRIMVGGESLFLPPLFLPLPLEFPPTYVRGRRGGGRYVTSPKNLLAFWAPIPGGNGRTGMGGIWVAFALSTLDNCRALPLPYPKGELPKNMKTSFFAAIPPPFSYSPNIRAAAAN